MNPIEEIHLRNRWLFHGHSVAAEKLSAADLTAETRGSYGSIRETLDHVLGALNIWEKRLRGESPTSIDGVSATAGMDDMRKEMDRLTDDMLVIVRDPLLDLARPVTYRNTAGEEHTWSVGQILMHVQLHGSDHLAQVAVLLTQAGVEPGDTDYLNYVQDAR